VKKNIITQVRYNSLVANICRQIVVSNWKPDCIVGVSGGGVILATMIGQYFNIPVEMLHINLHGKTPYMESNLWMAEDAYGYEASPKNMLIIADVNDDGYLLNWIMNDWQDSCHPQSTKWEQIWGNSVKFATLVDNTASKSRVKVSFTGVEINTAENDEFIEFPYENWWVK